MKKLDNTQYFKIQSDQEIRVSEVLQLVYQAMTEKGYDPVNQIVGYIMSGDPTYITSHKGARSLIMRFFSISANSSDFSALSPVVLFIFFGKPSTISSTSYSRHNSWILARFFS